MNDLQLGRLLRMRRMRHGWRLEDVAGRCRLSIATIARGENGAFASVGVVRRHGAALDLRIEWTAVGRGADVTRTLDDEHAAIVETVARWLRRFGIEVVAEASFSIYGERGRVDLLGLDGATRTLYLVEVKTELSDLQDLLGAVDIRERLAPRIAEDRGWRFDRRCSLLVLAATSHNREIVRAHTSLFGSWTRTTFRDATPPSAEARQLLWVPAALAGRSAWLAGRRRVPRAP
ncbi:MAG: helix-turn-helix domain-containing protein [Chloroflexota bacterium]